MLFDHDLQVRIIFYIPTKKLISRLRWKVIFPPTSKGGMGYKILILLAFCRTVHPTRKRLLYPWWSQFEKLAAQKRLQNVYEKLPLWQSFVCNKTSVQMQAAILRFGSSWKPHYMPGIYVNYNISYQGWAIYYRYDDDDIAECSTSTVLYFVKHNYIRQLRLHFICWYIGFISYEFSCPWNCMWANANRFCIEYSFTIQYPCYLKDTWSTKNWYFKYQKRVLEVLKTGTSGRKVLKVPPDDKGSSLHSCLCFSYFLLPTGFKVTSIAEPVIFLNPCPILHK